MRDLESLLIGLRQAPAMLVRVVRGAGSVPREVGAWMAVWPDRLLGTIGGGIILAFTTLFVFQLFGEVTVRSLSLPLPGPLAGMLLLLLGLILYKKIPKALEQTSTFLIQHLMLLFTPAVVGVMLYFYRIQEEWFPFLATIIIAIFLTLAISAFCLSWLLKREKNK